MIETLAGFAIFLALALIRVPMAFAMGIVGFGGVAYMLSFNAASSMIGQITYETGMSYTLSVIPLFILMGNFVVRARLSDEIYHAAYCFLGHRRGGLAMSTIVASAGFGAICGSSIATAATFSKVSYPSMRRYGYADALAAGSIAAGGTLGILIPPSVIMVIYGILTETSVGKLFIAGILPGIAGTVLLCLAVRWMVWRDPAAGPPAEPHPWAERWASLRHVWPMIGLFVLVIGGIYTGLFTPTEAGGVGAAGAFLFALSRRALTVRIVLDVLAETARTAAAMFVLLIGALMFSNYLEVSGFPALMLNWIKSLEVAPIVVILVIMAIYVVLGCILESLSMMLLTVPIFFPIISSLGYDPVWFGILIVVVIEISLITPPIGLNVFMLKAMMPEVPVTTIFRGVMPFIAADIVRLAIVVFAPAFVLFLPANMG